MPSAVSASTRITLVFGVGGQVEIGERGDDGRGHDQQQQGTGGAQAMRARSFAAGAGLAGFVPALDAAPATISSIASGSPIGAFQTVERGAGLGVFFEQDGHLWFNFTTGTATEFVNQGGAPTPLRDFSTGRVLPGPPWAPPALLTRRRVRLFNEAYYRAAPSRPTVAAWRTPRRGTVKG